MVLVTGGKGPPGRGRLREGLEARVEDGYSGGRRSDDRFPPSTLSNVQSGGPDPCYNCNMVLVTGGKWSGEVGTWSRGAGGAGEVPWPGFGSTRPAQHQAERGRRH